MANHRTIAVDVNEELAFAAFEALAAALPRRRRALALKYLLEITARAEAARPIRGDGDAEATYKAVAGKVRERLPRLAPKLLR